MIMKLYIPETDETWGYVGISVKLGNYPTVEQASVKILNELEKLLKLGVINNISLQDFVEVFNSYTESFIISLIEINEIHIPRNKKIVL